MNRQSVGHTHTHLSLTENKFKFDLRKKYMKALSFMIF